MVQLTSMDSNLHIIIANANFSFYLFLPRNSSKNVKFTFLFVAVKNLTHRISVKSFTFLFSSQKLI